MVEIDKNLSKDERILLAAEFVFCTRGYARATLDEIISLADTGKGTLYKYFGNKDNLFYTLISKKMNPLIQKLEHILNLDADTPTKIKRYMEAFLPFLRKNKEYYRILFYEIVDSQKGFHGIILENGTWDINSAYDETLSEEERLRILKYNNLIYSQVIILRNIINEGNEIGFIKKGDPSIMAHHLYGGITMTLLHRLERTPFSDSELVELIIDRLLYGHAVIPK